MHPQIHIDDDREHVHDTWQRGQESIACEHRSPAFGHCRTIPTVNCIANGRYGFAALIGCKASTFDLAANAYTAIVQ